MKIQTDIKPKQKIIAVVGDCNMGVYFRMGASKTQCVFIDDLGVGYLIDEPLERIAEHGSRTSISQGDSIIINF